MSVHSLIGRGGLRCLWVCLVLSGCLCFAPLSGLAADDQLRNLFGEVRQLSRAKKYQDALLIAERIRDLSLAKNGEYSDEHIRALEWLGDLNYDLQKYGAALPHYKKVLSLLKQINDRDDQRISRARWNLARTYYEFGQYQLALKEFEDALSYLAGKSGNANLMREASILLEIGRIYEIQKKYQRAIIAYRKASGIYSRLKMKNELVSAYSSIGNLKIKQRHFDDAIKTFKFALKLSEKKTFRDKHRQYFVQYRIGELYVLQGHYAEAESLFEQALKRSEKNGVKNDKLKVLLLNGLAILHTYQNKLGLAGPLFEQAIEINKNIGRTAGRDIAMLYSNLSYVRQRQSKYEVAEKLLIKSSQLRINQLEADHPENKHHIFGFAWLYEAQKKYKKAITYYEQGLEFSKKVFGENSAEVAAALTGLGRCQAGLKQFTKAEANLKEALRIGKNELRIGHPSIRIIVKSLAELMNDLSRFEEADAYFQEYESFPDPGSTQLRVFYATNRLRKKTDMGELYTAMRGEKLVAGVADVIVPRNEVHARTLRLFFLPADGRLPEAELTSSTELVVRRKRNVGTNEIMLHHARQYVAKATKYPNQILLYVHGFNVSFEEALKQVAQLTHELDFDGAPLVFTWPTRKKIFGYLNDKESATIAVNYLVELIDRIHKQMPDVQVHVVAHSMGNVVLLGALEKLALKHGSDGDLFLGDVILAHADVDSDRLKQLVGAARPIVSGITLYSTADDKAFKFLDWILGMFDRAGKVPVIVEGLDSIDFTGLGSKTFSLNHSIFASNPVVFGDITKLLKTGERPPNKRTPVFVETSSDGGIYWKYQESADKVASDF